MRVNICSYLLALVLGCNLTAGIIKEIVKEQASASLPCPHSVEGQVTWSREINGRKVDILTIDGDQDIRFNDPGKRFSSEGNKSLHIRRTTMSDSGRYRCNDEAAVELTVIPSEPSRLDATEGNRVSLTCPHAGESHVVTWSSRELGDIQDQKGFYVSPFDQTLTITSVELDNSGLYYCNGKPAVYLNVIKGNKAPPTTSVSTTTTTSTTRQTSAAATTVSSTTRLSRTPQTKKPRKNRNKKNNDNESNKAPPTTSVSTTTTTSTTRQTSAAATTVSSTTKKRNNRSKNNKDNEKADRTPTTAFPSVVTTVDGPSRSLVIGITVSSLSIIIVVIIIVIFYCTRKYRYKRQGSGETCPVYDEIQDKLEFQPTNGSAGQTVAIYCMAEFPAGSTCNDPTYCIIPDLPLEEETSETSLPNHCQYSLIGDICNGNNEDSSQPTDNLYSLLEQPKVP